MLTNAIYINTTPGAQCLFAPPEATEDYAGWLQLRQKATQFKDGIQTCHYGLSQKINQILQASKSNGVHVFAIGTYAAQASQFLEALGVPSVEVLG